MNCEYNCIAMVEYMLRKQIENFFLVKFILRHYLINSDFEKNSRVVWMYEKQ